MTDRPRCGGFTLIELLVVIGVIALLVALLLPALGAVRKRGEMLDCLSRQRQLIAACTMYASDFRERMPHPNWGVQSQGWLYTAPRDDVLADEGRLGPSTGTIWTYLSGDDGPEAAREIYTCPSHEEREPGTTELITSFIFNGALCNYSDLIDFSFRIYEFRSDAVIAWEAQTRGEGGNDSWNDGGSQPREGLTTRHGVGATTSAVDGSARWITSEEWEVLLEQTPGPLWCVPTARTTGGALN